MSKPALAQKLDLEPHPEGGWFRQTWRSPVEFAPSGYPGVRAAATGIFFLLAPGEESRWHVVRSDELWVWQSGGPLVLSVGSAPGAPDVRDILLGPEGEFQGLVPGGQWQAARPVGVEPVLVTCVVAPGFEYEDWQLA
ncbi:cupin domain-containing protein [Cryptosporangium phraense]|uniref:Cupin domain-containing protein n=1 Tax=Cryptosporangium phraense TaxID=2593070 RepID=A0A545AEB3_9ACTN|nr:cupin domain-containing protein [Cryptosporangium phraense]TQS39664.1 cupin domain-containing protein [Cryptosporangium phraense]